MSAYKIVTTRDNSHTLIHPRFNEHYHSVFGAIQESEHVFIQSGLAFLPHEKKTIHVLELGFGTGLNALLSYLWSLKNDVKICYTGLEAYPVPVSLAAKLNYHELVDVSLEVFMKMHSNKKASTSITEHFMLTRIKDRIEYFEPENSKYDVVFFDAFSPETQPELWTEVIFKKLYRSLKNGGVLTTYSTKGIVKRAMKSSGFIIEKLPGPPGKREILRAIKL